MSSARAPSTPTTRPWAPAWCTSGASSVPDAIPYTGATAVAACASAAASSFATQSSGTKTSVSTKSAHSGAVYEDVVVDEERELSVDVTEREIARFVRREVVVGPQHREVVLDGEP